ncbi:MAG TPA: serine/threonine-protein kinase [Verrucomicrobiae bacterium]|nr:serine/threonine-protein kinase [Verrucomicrobiae bacterium]
MIRPIGQGAYGEVWLARNATGSYRAVKIIHRNAFADGRPYDREFAGLQKFEPLSRSHPGLVNVLHVGRQTDHFYYVMELGDDELAGSAVDPERYSPRTLRSEIERHECLDAAACLQVGLVLTSALSHLHTHGLVHRDVKPSNIIFVNGCPKLADVGLVTSLGDQASHVGSPGYIPPEGPGTPGADLFSLGKVLYQAAGGREFPVPPTNVRPDDDHDLRRELHEVVLHACENDPRRRYPSAQAMWTDLEFIRIGRSVIRHQSRRARARLAAAGLVAAFVIALAAWIKRTQAPTSSDEPTRNIPAALAGSPGGTLLDLVYHSSPPATNASVHLQLEMAVRRIGQAQFVALRDGESVVSEQEPYRLLGQALTPGWLYLFQIDSSGHAQWIFPQNNSCLHSSGANPVAAGRFLSVPSGPVGDAFYLDRVTGVEHVYAVFTAAPWPALEEQLLRASTAFTNQTQGRTRVSQPNGLRTRGIGGTLKTALVATQASPAPLLQDSPLLRSQGSFLVLERWFRHVE